ncbi:MAG: hypothetical protein ACLFV5_10960, partial [Anaerolineales bacterium]
DASLGVPETDEMYAQVITPGYVIHLSVEGETYTYHAADGRVVLASPDNGDAGASLEIVGVRVARDDGQMTVRGETSLPDETCIQTELLVDDEVVSWWPDTACAEVQDGLWEMEVSLPPAGTPAAMGSDEASRAMYVVQARARDHDVEAVPFPFDLYGPPPCE